MHSGFAAIRSAMPCNIRGRRRLPRVDPGLDGEIARVADIWSQSEGPGLCGPFSAADIFYAPIATRFVTYAISLSGGALDYQHRLLGSPLVQEWCAMAEHEPEEPGYERPVRDERDLENL
jgi:glutathione S-transferase